MVLILLVFEFLLNPKKPLKLDCAAKSVYRPLNLIIEVVVMRCLCKIEV